MTAPSTSTTQDTAVIPRLCSTLVQRVRSLSRRAGTSCIVLCAIALAPGSALANSHAYKSLPFDEGFREATSRMLQGMSDGSCYVNRGRREDGIATVVKTLL